MKFIKMSLALILAITASGSFANKNEFKKIQEVAQIGNGDASIGNYNVKATKGAVQAKSLATMKSEYWEGCGPWKTVTSRREIIQMIRKLETESEVSPTAEILTKLYDANEIFAATGAISNNNVECSQSWFDIFGTDGSVLHLRYSMGD